MDHEKTEKNMRVKRRVGFGLREIFWESQLSEVMTEEQAEKLGYVKEMDYEKSHRLVMRNHTIYNHATAELRKDMPEIYNSRTVLMANFFFILRIVSYHLVLTGLANNPVP
jgi:hypothetical protein